jgi:hypothetical protein
MRFITDSDPVPRRRWLRDREALPSLGAPPWTFSSHCMSRTGGQTVAGVASQPLSLLCYLVLAKPLVAQKIVGDGMGRLSWRPLLRFPPPWSGEELDNERRGRSASPPSSWAVSRNRHHMPILQYSGSLVCSVLHTIAEFSPGVNTVPALSSATGFILEIDIGQLLPGAVRQSPPSPRWPGPHIGFRAHGT